MSQFFWNLSQTDITVRKGVICPCITPAHDVNYDCLLEEIEKKGPIHNICMEIIQSIGSKFSRSVNFQVIDFGTSIDCAAEAYQLYYDGHRSRRYGTIIFPDRYYQEFCMRMKWKFEVLSHEKQFYDVLAANLARLKLPPISCLLEVQAVQGQIGSKSQTSTCTEHSANPCLLQPHACTRVLYQLFSYSDGAFHSGLVDMRNNSGHGGVNLLMERSLFGFPMAHSFKLTGATNKKGALSLGTFLIAGQAWDISQVRYGRRYGMRQMAHIIWRSNYEIAQTVVVQFNCSWYKEVGKKYSVKLHSIALVPSPFSIPLSQSYIPANLEWEPNIELQSMRIYRSSIISFSLNWKCQKSWLKIPGHIQLVCNFLQFEHYPECFKCLKLAHDSEYCEMCPTISSFDYEVIGPILKTELQWEEIGARFQIQSNLENQVFPDGSIKIFPNEQRMPHIFR